MRGKNRQKSVRHARILKAFTNYSARIIDMKVLGINGSPRIGGNTDILLDRVLEGAKSKGAKTEKIILNKLKFSPCQECENLPDDGSCIVEDDMKAIYEKIKDIDSLILASPIFFGSLSAQTKMMMRASRSGDMQVLEQINDALNHAHAQLQGTKPEDWN